MLEGNASNWYCAQYRSRALLDQLTFTGVVHGIYRGEGASR